MRWSRKKTKAEGPFKANRILDTEELKIDQVFTKEGEKPVALFTHTREKEAQKIGAKGFVGPIGGQVDYASGKQGVTQGYYFANNISERGFREGHDEIVKAGKTTGSAIPNDVPFTKVEKGKSIPITPSTFLTSAPTGSIAISGDFVVSGDPKDFHKPTEDCTYCGCSNEVNEDFYTSARPQYCKRCGKNLRLNFNT